MSVKSLLLSFSVVSFFSFFHFRLVLWKRVYSCMVRVSHGLTRKQRVVCKENETGESEKVFPPFPFFFLLPLLSSFFSLLTLTCSMLMKKFKRRYSVPFFFVPLRGGGGRSVSGWKRRRKALKIGMRRKQKYLFSSPFLYFSNSLSPTNATRCVCKRNVEWNGTWEKRCANGREGRVKEKTETRRQRDAFLFFYYSL